MMVLPSTGEAGDEVTEIVAVPMRDHLSMSPSSSRVERRHPKLLDYEGAGLRLGCTPRMVRKLVETRQIDHIKVGRLVRLEESALADYVERRRVKAC